MRRLAEGPDGSIYGLGAGGGVHRYSGGRWESWAHPRRDDVNSVFSLLVRPDGTHWVVGDPVAEPLPHVNAVPSWCVNVLAFQPGEEIA